MELPKANPTACRLGIREKQVEVKDPQPPGWGFRTVSLKKGVKGRRHQKQQYFSSHSTSALIRLWQDPSVLYNHAPQAT
jgi:hypothetical protein